MILEVRKRIVNWTATIRTTYCFIRYFFLTFRTMNKCRKYPPPIVIILALLRLETRLFPSNRSGYLKNFGIYCKI